MTRKSVIIASLLLSWATAAVAGTYHYATRATQEEAMKAATAEARSRAARKRTCYRPAWTVNDCTAVPGGVRCRAESANHHGSCEGRGYLSAGRYAPPQLPLIPVYPLPEIPELPRRDLPDPPRPECPPEVCVNLEPKPPRA